MPANSPNGVLMSAGDVHSTLRRAQAMATAVSESVGVEAAETGQQHAISPADPAQAGWFFESPNMIGSGPVDRI